jgi:hypothetical protein
MSYLGLGIDNCYNYKRSFDMDLVVGNFLASQISWKADQGC